jgi:undecaprenyl diphosphate synthase
MTTTLIYDPQQLAHLDKTRIPKHVAFIPDGNRRWAALQAEKIEQGHRSGAYVLIDNVKAALELGIKVLTYYMFSTENWNRSQEEVSALMWLLQEFLIDNRQEMLDLGVRLRTIGNINKLPAATLTVVNESCEATAHCTNIDMVMALNYGSRDELCRAVQTIAKNIQNGTLAVESITEELIAKNLDTAPWGDPDMLIRTSGEARISNFLLWQISYAELYMTNTLWPDFKPQDLLKAVIEFQHRHRRMGGT